MPQALTPIPPETLHSLTGLTFTERAFTIAVHLLKGDLLVETLHKVVDQAFNFPVPMRRLDDSIWLMELFHGPTCAFKDFGARFMARTISALSTENQGAESDSPPWIPPANPEGKPLTVLVATSGDTGGAVADAFYRIPGVRVVILYPLDKVSPRQEAQLCNLGHNIKTLAVKGVFDDCQHLVREAFANQEMRRAFRLTSANSINVGRLLPQIFYYVHAWAELTAAKVKKPPVISVPSGNFGNLTAGLMAQLLGTPISHFVAATNANATVPDYLTEGVYRPRQSVATISSAMDVGNPSNFRRIRHLLNEDLAKIQHQIQGYSFSDAETRACIHQSWHEHGTVLDPHTAVGLLGLRAALANHPPGTPGVVLATAHPAKFAETVEPIIQQELPVPDGIARFLGKRPQRVEIEPTLTALLSKLNIGPV